MGSYNFNFVRELTFLAIDAFLYDNSAALARLKPKDFISFVEQVKILIPDNVVTHKMIQEKPVPQFDKKMPESVKDFFEESVKDFFEEIEVSVNKDDLNEVAKKGSDKDDDSGEVKDITFTSVQDLFALLMKLDSEGKAREIGWLYGKKIGRKVSTLSNPSLFKSDLRDILMDHMKSHVDDESIIEIHDALVRC